MARGGASIPYQPGNIRLLSNYNRKNQTIKKLNRNSLNANKQALLNQYMNLNMTRKNLNQKIKNYDYEYVEPFEMVANSIQQYYNKSNSKGKANIRKSVRNFLNTYGVNTKNMNSMTLKNRMTPNLLKSRYLRKVLNTKIKYGERPEAKQNSQVFQQERNLKEKIKQLQYAILN